MRGASLELDPPPAPLPSGLDDPSLVDLLRSNGAWDPALCLSQWWTPYGALPGSPAAGARISIRGALTVYSAAQVSALDAFFTCMAVCHTVVPERETGSGKLLYQAESPDEASLVQAARDVGYEFSERRSDSITMVRRCGDREAAHHWATFGVHEFNSTRKRMGTVVRCPAGRYFLYVKGADNVMFARTTGQSAEARAEMDAHLTSFANKGLRTLVLGVRELSADQFAAWRAEFSAAALRLEKREEALAEVAEKWETGLAVLGASAIEDRLQEGVPATIRDFRLAGIKTWVLTGDKVETAINIGYAARLLDPAMQLLEVTSEDRLLLKEQLAQLERDYCGPPPRAPGEGGGWGGWLLRRCGGGGVDGEPPCDNTPITGPPLNSGSLVALVVSGPALSIIMDKGNLDSAVMTRGLLRVGNACKSVLACRVSPAQKASIVDLVKKGVFPTPLTLASGDGANDVGMIQTADVGVGISGKEGLQAANSADFSIAQFRFLKRLLLLHGRWDYRRLTKVVLYSFYKNVVITLTLFFFNALAEFSGTSLYESIVYATYNFVLGLPIIAVGVLDKDVSEE